jgi:lysozyme family protein
MADFNLAYPKIKKDEGKFQNYSNDSANYCRNGNLVGTNLGISTMAYEGYYGYCPSVEQMKNLTEAQAKEIYKNKYWDKLNLDKVKNQSVAALMMQYIIGSGASQISDIKAIANKTNETGNKISENDNKPTDSEIDFINKLDQRKFWNNLKEWRMNFYDRLVKSNPEKYSPFLKGWQNRLNSYKYEPTVNEKKK